eukprot:1273158-Pyramimonas_sp.AAC.1
MKVQVRSSTWKLTVWAFSPLDDPPVVQGGTKCGRCPLGPSVELHMGHETCERCTDMESSPGGGPVAGDGRGRRAGPLTRPEAWVTMNDHW